MPGLSAEEIYARRPQDGGEDGDGQVVDDPGGMGGVNDPPSGGDQPVDPGQPGQPTQLGSRVPSAADLARQEETWVIAAAQAEATAKAMGIGAGDTARAIREQVLPKIDWRDVLRRYLSAAAKSNYAWPRRTGDTSPAGSICPRCARSLSRSIPVAASMRRRLPPSRPRSPLSWTSGAGGNSCRPLR